MNDLFGIKLMILRSELNVETFRIYESLLTIFSLYTLQIEVRLVAIKSDYFSRTLPLKHVDGTFATRIIQK